MEDLRVTNVKYFQTRRGIGYTCNTNIEGTFIENDGNGGATYLYSKNPFYHNIYSEIELEELINKYENLILDKTNF